MDIFISLEPFLIVSVKDFVSSLLPVLKLLLYDALLCDFLG